MKKISLMLAALLLMCMVFVSCGKKGEETPDTVKEWIEYEKVYRESPVYDLLSDQWKKEEAEQPEYLMKSVDFHSKMLESHYHMSIPRYAVGGDKFYRLEGYWLDEDNKEYVLDILDSNTLEKVSVVYDASAGSMMNLYVSAGQIWGYNEEQDEEGFIESLQVVQLFEDGTHSEPVDITGALDSGDIVQEAAHFILEVQYIYEASSGNHYILPDNGASLSMMDNEGKVIAHWRGFSDNRSSIELLCQTSDGTCLFRCKDLTTNDTKIFYFKDNEPVVLMPEGNILCLDMQADSHGNLIYRSADNSLVEWNPATGKQTKLYAGSRDTFEFLVGIVRNEAGDLLILNDEGELMKLSYVNPENEVTITLQTYPFATYDLKEAVRRYEQLHGGVHFEILERAFGMDDVDSEFGKIYTEISEGGGPDIIQLDREHMKYFNEKGCLLDFTGAMPEEITAAIYDGVLEAGVDRGRQVMLPYMFDIYALLVQDDIWPGDSWTIAEFIEVLDRLEEEGIEVENLEVSGWGIMQYPFNTLIRDIAHSDFLDIEAGTCSFDTPAFIHLLEVCKRYHAAAKRELTAKMADGEFMDGRIITRSSYFVNFYEFSSDMKHFGGNCHYVGYPSNAGNGNFLYCRTGFAINKNTEHADEILDFFRYLYTYDRVKDSSLGSGNKVEIRRDYYDGRILNGEDMNWSNTPQIRESGHTYAHIDGKPDGTTFIEEYKAFRDSLAVYDDEYDFIKSILWEEAEPYFEGDLRAETVAGTIQSRVQLYLDEK